jgi:antitoxin component YwqK of YwqJK toxin-antitoxin module
MGFMFGSPFGIIGAGAGALLGFIYGNLAKRDEEAKAEQEAQRQEAVDADLERQIEERKAQESASASGGKAAPGRKQGVTVVKDHLADRSPGPPTASASAPPGGAAGHAAPPDADAEGFRPVYEGGRLVRRERDAQGDGRPDTILHYDASGQLVRREDSSRLDGRMDLWAHYVDGKVVRKESDTRRSGQVDLWIHYDEHGNVARAEALVENDVKLTQIFTDGRVAREEWRRHPGGQLTAVAIHQDGKVVQREEDSTGQGRLDLVSVFDGDGRLLKQGRRADEGWLMSWRHFDPGGRVVREEELRKDGEIVAVSFFENGRLTRKELYVLDEELFRRAPRVPDAAVTEG